MWLDWAHDTRSHDGGPGIRPALSGGRSRRAADAGSYQTPQALVGFLQRSGPASRSVPPSRFASARSPRTFLIYSSFDGLSDDFRV